ncbi:hypothetical protein [Algoriphagus sp. AK58]|uniref:hypothetical protein n=1 Tax=Algoriphagus sp. AK58 TaxID=1406877 RepID=UPI00164F1DDE|nr:hypothetical protein [Algoriphagus sp. AK58]MBC6367851.1 hypothetical protein [Algoriphagus sp. AK58]
MISIDPVTAVLSLVLFSAFAAPFVYHFQKNKKKENLLTQNLKEAAKNAGANPDQMETWRHQYAIGLDTSKKVLVYHHDGEVATSFCIPLSEVKKVSVLKKTKEVGESKKSVIEHIGLEVQYVSSTKKSILLEIFNEDLFSDLIGESVLAEKWAEIIRKHL